MNVPMRRGVCPSLSRPMQTGDGLLVRLRPLEGGLSPEQLGLLADAAASFGNGVLEVTRRGNLQIRGLSAESAVGLADAVNAIGIAIAGGVPVETGPLAGLDTREIADPRPVARAIREAIAGAGFVSRLGPKVSVVVDGGGALPMDEVAADLRLVAQGEGRWLVSVGGTAKEASSFGVVAEGEAANVALSVLEIVAAKGLRARSRDLTLPDTMKIWRPTLPPSGLPAISPSRGEIMPAVVAGAFSSTSKIGAAADDSVISPLEGEMAALRPRLRRPEGGNVGRISSPIGMFSLVGGKFALGIGLPFGQTSAQALHGLAEKARAYGASEIRFTPGRALLAVGLAAEGCGRLKEAARALGFVTDPADPRLFIAACAGSPACRSAFIATKAIAADIARSAADLLDGSFILHVSGCPKGCARPPAPLLSLVGTAPESCEMRLEGRDAAIAQAGGGDAAARIVELALLFRERHRKGETAGAFLDRLGRAGLSAVFSINRA